MTFQVGKPDRDRTPRRPPPNYFSRRVQLRLFTLVAMVMLVFWLMEQARRPESWYWMWGGNPEFVGGPLTEEELAGGSRDVDTRLDAEPEQATEPGVFVSPGTPSLLDAEEHEASPEDERLGRTRADAWSRILRRLGSEDEEQFRTMLQAAREGKFADDEKLQKWPEIVAQLDAGWDEYLQDAFQYLIDARDQLSDSQRAAWQSAVQQLEIEWRQTTHPALETAASGAALSNAELKTIAALGDELDRIDLATVRDNSVFRTAERHAWFRLLEKLGGRELEAIESDSTGRVGFIQLFDQPKEYRGKLVTVRGTAHMAYRVEAPRNSAGVEHYYVFWIAPAGGPNSPICVYSLQTPPGFPAIKDKDRDRETTPLDVDVEFTGYFFKRWAYRAQDGLRIAPLVLAKAPRWTPPPPSIAATSPASPWNLAIYILGAAGAAVAISLLAYWQGQWRSAKKRGYETAPDRFQQRLKALEDDDPAEDVRETLRRMSEQP